MNRFPPQFADILNARGRRLLESSREPFPQFSADAQGPDAPIAHFSDIIQRRKARALIQLLDERVFAHIDTGPDEEFPAFRPLPSGYAKYVRSWNSPYSSRLRMGNADAEEDPMMHRIARRIGLSRFMNSDTLLEFVRRVTGYRVAPRNGQVYCQVSCYCTGDYIGLHSDLHRRNGKTRHFVLCQLNLPNDAVANQMLVHQQGPYLSGAVNHDQPGVSVLRLPFWHMATPLQPKAGHEAHARRWVAMASMGLLGYD